ILELFDSSSATKYFLAISNLSISFSEFLQEVNPIVNSSNRTIVLFIRIRFVLMCYNVLALGEGGDFYHKTSLRSRMFKFTKNCQTENRTPACAKPLLCAVLLVGSNL